MAEFYDQLAPLYHLIFQDWDRSIARQAQQLTELIRNEWGLGIETALDVSCGIGTQAIGLAQRGFRVTESDLASVEIYAPSVRRRREASMLRSPFATCAKRINTMAAVTIS